MKRLNKMKGEETMANENKDVGNPWQDDCELSLKFILKYKLSAEQVAYKFKRTEIGYLCQYLGLPYDQARKEIESARMLLSALKDIDNG